MKTPVKTEAKTKFRMKLYTGYSNNVELHETEYHHNRSALSICDTWARVITDGMALRAGAVVDVSITVRAVKPLAKKVK